MVTATARRDRWRLGRRGCRRQADNFTAQVRAWSRRCSVAGLADTPVEDECGDPPGEQCHPRPGQGRREQGRVVDRRDGYALREQRRPGSRRVRSARTRWRSRRAGRASRPRRRTRGGTCGRGAGWLRCSRSVVCHAQQRATGASSVVIARPITGDRPGDEPAGRQVSTGTEGEGCWRGTATPMPSVAPRIPSSAAVAPSRVAARRGVTPRRRRRARCGGVAGRCAGGQGRAYRDDAGQQKAGNAEQEYEQPRVDRVFACRGQGRGEVVADECATGDRSHVVVGSLGHIVPAVAGSVGS